MKALITLFFFVAILSVSTAQTIRRVNADATVTGTNVYHTLQAAHDAATAGDVLIVEPGTNVGDLTCTKALTIYGRGYFLDKNSSYAALVDNVNASSVGTITINAGNVKISGCIASSIIINGASSVTISRMFMQGGNTILINGLASAPANNITITQSYMTYFELSGNPTGLISNLIFSNNQVANYIKYDNSNCSNVLINQNTINNLFGYATANTALTNNIFYSAQFLTGANTTNSTFNNNVFEGTSTLSGIVGANNVIQSNLSTYFASNTGGSSDNNYRTTAGSPLKTASTSGGEVGMFGGATPYVQYGIPAAPAVLKLLNSGLGNATTPINATISATSNN